MAFLFHGKAFLLNQLIGQIIVTKLRLNVILVDTFSNEHVQVIAVVTLNAYRTSKAKHSFYE